MTTLFTIDLTINMPDGGRYARKLLNLYFTDMPVDINATAYNLCDANEAVQTRKFAKLTLKRADAWSSQEGSLQIFALLSVTGEDATFIEQAVLLDGGFPMAGFDCGVEGLAGPDRRRGDGQVGHDADVGHERADPFCGILAAFGERALLVGAKCGIPIGLSMTKDQQRAHWWTT